METLLEKNKLKDYHWYLLLGLLCFCIASILFFERIPIENGLGWDGTIYYNMTVNFQEQFLNHYFAAYYFQRCFPSALSYYFLIIIDYFLTLTGNATVGTSVPAVINSFFVWNTLAVIGSNYYLFKIYNKFQFEKKLQIICFLLFNLSFHIAKLVFYNPVLTDHIAVFIATALLYAYLFGNNKYLLLLFFIGYFTTPMLFFVGSILFIFPYKIADNAEELKILPIRKFSLPIHLILAFLIVLYFIYKLVVLEKHNWVKTYNETPINFTLAPLSIILAICYILGIIFLFYRTNSLEKLLNNIHLGHFLLISTIYIILSQSIHYYFPNEGISKANFVNGLVLRSIKKPLLFYFSDFFYFGISFILPFLYYSYWSKITKQIGLGAMLVLFVHLALMMASESRGFISIYPFLIIFSGILIRDFFTIDYKMVMLFGFISFLMSTVWLPINLKPDYQGGMPYLYAIHHGPWMPTNFYYVLVPFCIVVSLFLIYFLKTKKKTLLP